MILLSRKGDRGSRGRSSSCRAFPSPCTAFSQALSVNSRIQGEQAGHLRLDHVTRNDLAAWNNEAQELARQVEPTSNI